MRSPLPRPRRHFASAAVSILLAMLVPWPVWAQDTPQAEKDMAFAQGLYRQQNYLLAGEKFVAFVKQYPNHANASLAAFRAGECLFRLGRFSEAVPYFEQVVQRFPDGAEAEAAWCWLGDSCYKAEQYEQAASAYESLLAKFPAGEQIGRAAYWLGESYHHLGRHEEAISAYDTSLTKAPDGEEAPYAAYAIGWTYLQLRKPAEALVYLRAVPTRHPQSPVAAECGYLAGVALQDQGDHDAAAAQFSQVVAQHGNTAFAPRAQMGLGWCRFHRKEYTQAREAFARVTADYPDGPEAKEARLRLADCDFFLERWDEAAAAYAAIAQDETDPFAPEALYWLAIARERQARATEALETHRQLVARFPDSGRVADAYLHIGRLESQAGHTEVALAAYESALGKAKTDEQTERAQKGLAWAKYQSDKAGGSLAELDQLVRQNPAAAESLDLGYRVAGAHFETGRYQEALSLTRLLLDGHPDTPLVWALTYLAGLCEDKLGQDAEAEKSLRQVLEQGGKSQHAPAAAAALVGIYARQGNLDRAREIAGELQKPGADGQAAAFALYSVAEALLKADSPADAVVLYSQALELDPEGATAPFAQAGLGWAKLSAGEADAAEAFRILARKHATSEAASQAPGGLLAVAEKLYAQEKYAGAQELYEEVLADFAASEAAPKAQYKLGWALMKQDRNQEAMGHLAQAARADTDPAIRADAAHQAARLLADSGEFARAVELLAPLQQATEPADKLGWAMALLGRCYATLGKHAEAMKVFESVAERFPEHSARADVLVGIARIHREQKQPDKALAAAEKALEIANEEGAEAHFEIAACYRDLGETNRAAEEFLKVAILYGDRQYASRAQFEAGQCYEQTGDKQTAIATYEVAVRDYPEQEELVKRAQARIDALGAQ